MLALADSWRSQLRVDDYLFSMIENDREVIEDAKADDMFIAEGNDKSGCGLKSTHLNSTSKYCR